MSYTALVCYVFCSRMDHLIYTVAMSLYDFVLILTNRSVWLPVFSSIFLLIPNTHLGTPSSIALCLMHYTGESETVTAEEIVENHRFINAICATRVMKHVHKYLVSQGKSPSGVRQFKEQLYDLWFKLYRRTRGSRALDSSGFEHVFVGETRGGTYAVVLYVGCIVSLLGVLVLCYPSTHTHWQTHAFTHTHAHTHLRTDGYTYSLTYPCMSPTHGFTPTHTGKDVLGFHNWLQLYLQEKAGNVDYQGYILGKKVTAEGQTAQATAILSGMQLQA